LLQLLDHPLGYRGCPEEAARAEQEQHTDRLVGELDLQASPADLGLLRQLSYLLRQQVWKTAPQMEFTPCCSAHTLPLSLPCSPASPPCLQVDDDGSIYYHEVLQALTAKAAGISLEALGDKINRELQEEVGSPLVVGCRISVCYRLNAGQCAHAVQEGKR
jgi:hypothetical protein